MGEGNKLHSRSGDENNGRKNNAVVFKCPFTPAVQRMGIPQEYMRLRRELQAIKGSDFMRDVRCVMSHPTSSNCFIESHGLNSVPDDLRRQAALQQVSDADSPGGRRGLRIQINESD